MYVIDYEYAGNNDPMWDLGDLSVEGGFTPEQDDALLRAYFGVSRPHTRSAGWSPTGRCATCCGPCGV
ncbi:MAG: phosphotransferase [Ilumatobacteraceae bacterium]